MLKFIILFSLLNSTQIIANDKKDILSPSEKTQVLRFIDNTCSDSWCEGDYDFKFTKFNCNKSLETCELNFFFIKRDENEKKTFSKLQTCQFKNIKSFDQIIDNEWSLNENFYLELTDCISNLEDSIQF